MIGLVVGVLVLGGGVWYLAKQAPAPTAGNEAAVGQNAGMPSTGSGSIASLMAMGGDYECTVSITAAQTPTTGTIDLSGGKMYGAFTTSVSGTTVHAYMVNDGTYVYSWSDVAPQGVRVPVSSTPNGEEQAQAGFDPNTAVDYSCTAWTPDPSVFVPPASMTFVTYGTKG